MSIGSIKRISYRLNSSDEFTDINFTGFSGSLQKKVSRTAAGNLHVTTVDLRKTKITAETTAELDNLLNRKAEFKIIDGNNKYHYVGDVHFPARLTYEQNVDGNAGSFNGYRIKITHTAPESYLIS